MRFIYILLLSIFLLSSLSSQSFNDCESAYRIDSPEDFCTSSSFFDLRNAGESLYDIPNCFGPKNNDIWAYFIAEARDVTIIAKGNTSVDPQGSLDRIDIALYEGTCGGTLTNLVCVSGNTQGISELYRGGLTIGRKYFIRIQSADERPGSFQLCTKNYNPVNEPQSDCVDGVIICNKDPIVVKAVTGGGADNQETKNVPCNLSVEQSSTWYKFTCGKSGTLEFVITPLNNIDDLDFVLFELPNGIDDCSDKISIRCMAAGEDPSLYPSPCHGPTGLKAGNSDTNEQPGCDDDQNNFLSPANLEAGKAYALVINNFTSTGNGLQIEWGGTAEFQGPKPIVNFEVDDPRLCYENKVIYSAIEPSSDDMIIEWKWYFGENATPSTAIGKGPHEISYNKAGINIAVLEVKTEMGCLTTIRTPIELVCCDITESIELKGDTDLKLGEQSFITSSVKLKGDSISYYWSPPEHIECPTCQNTNVTPLEEMSTFVLYAEDQYGCSIEDSISINVEINYRIFTPNAFTPNGDGNNDIFFINTNIAAHKINYLRIFNRWGSTIYEANNIPPNDKQYGWNGKFKGVMVDPGIYTYSAEIEFLNGHREYISGDLHLLR